MPVLNARARAKTASGQDIPSKVVLAHGGPRFPVLVGLHPTAVKAIEKSGEKPARILQGQGLIDTGASVTCIDERAAEELGLVPIGTVDVGGVSGESVRPMFAFSLAIPGLGALNLSAGVGCDIRGMGLIILLGTDALSDCLFVYDGNDGSYTLAV